MKKATNKNILDNILKKINDENEIEAVKKSPNKYCSIVDEYGISNKLNQVIDGFKAENPEQSELYNKLDLNIGIICDEFLYYSLKDTANFIYLPYEEQLHVQEELDLVLIVSSWRGLDNSWDYVANPKGRKREKLIELIKMYKENDITTIFYSKEDPVSYNEYLSLAKECDYIFTSARESVEKYKVDTGNENVDYLEFGVNPMYHNPIGKDLSDKYLSKQVTFAGSWMKRFPERNQEALRIFEGVNKTDYQLCIIDRHYERQMERYHYPPFLLKNVSATIPHERLMKLHKATMWGINLNSVKNSNTMFANRVYELQAMGNIVISNYNVGVHNKFSNILLVNSRKDVENILNSTNLKDQKRLIANGLRKVMLDHTAYHRVAKIAETIGIDYQIKKPKVLIVGSGENSKNSFNKQVYSGLYYIDQNEFNKDFINLEKYDFISFFSDNINYEEYYIGNLLSTFAYTEADIVFMNKDKYDYTDKSEFIKSTAMIKSNSYSFSDDMDDELIYFNIPRTEISKVETNQIEKEDNKLLTAVIPIDNEYNYLEDKIIFSINKFDLDKDMRLLLLDSGHQGLMGKKVIERILYKYPNVKYISCEEDDISISKLKNIALKEITTDYVVFLNGQNQLASAEFKKMVDKIKENNNIDIIYGKRKSFNNRLQNYEKFRNEMLKTLESFDKSIQSIIIKTSLLTEYNIKFDENFYNDEELFLLKIFNKAKEINEINQLVYYDYRSGNNNYNFTASEMLYTSLNIETKKKPLLEDLDILKSYSNEVFPYDFLEYYLDYLRDEKNEKITALNRIKELFSLYEPYYDGNNDDLNKITNLLFDYQY